jgi:hypothetical protein
MMRPSFVYLLPLVVSLTHGHSARHLLQRVLLENADVDTLGDWSCMTKGATSKTSCEEDEDEESDNDCFWCPFGTDVGACVSSGQGYAINKLHFPNLVCGALDKDAAPFWDEQMGCSVAATTQAECLSTSTNGGFSCTWCVVHDPPFAMCMGQEFMETIEELQPDEEPIRIAEVIHCSTDVSKNDHDHEDIYGLMDLSCVMAGKLGGGDEGACLEAADATGRNCVSVMTALTGEACVTETQNELLSWTMDLMEDMGVKIQNFELPKDALESDMDEGDEEDGGSRA